MSFDGAFSMSWNTGGGHDLAKIALRRQSSDGINLALSIQEHQAGRAVEAESLHERLVVGELT